VASRAHPGPRRAPRTDASKAAQVEFGLFAFQQLERVNVQLALPRGQARRELKRPQNRIVLAP
jgi:hypothetical protein